MTDPTINKSAADLVLEYITPRPMTMREIETRLAEHHLAQEAGRAVLRLYVGQRIQMVGDAKDIEEVKWEAIK